MSVMEITSPIAFDLLKNPYPGGLYDRRLGVSPYDKTGTCETCGQSEQECPGHFGHINLCLPVLNQFMIKNLEKFLQSICFNCERFTYTDA